MIIILMWTYKDYSLYHRYAARPKFDEHVMAIVESLENTGTLVDTIPVVWVVLPPNIPLAACK
jgi:hypothetical protein